MTTNKPFTFEYSATAGVIIAATLREKAQQYRAIAEGYHTNAGLGTNLQDFYLDQARIADNNAELLENAATQIHTPVRNILIIDIDRALNNIEDK